MTAVSPMSPAIANSHVPTFERGTGSIFRTNTSRAPVLASTTPNPGPTTAPPAVVPGAASGPEPTPSPSPGPRVPTPEEQAAAQAAADKRTITVVDLNAAMGLGMGANNPLGTDLNTTDVNLLADDILRDKNPDVVTLQEMALAGATGTTGTQGLQQALEAKTGDKWTLYFGDSGLQRDTGNGAKGATYYASETNKSDNGGVVSPAGNAILVRTGSGIQSSRSITADQTLGDNGVRLQASGTADNTNDGKIPGSVVGVELTTSEGKKINVFTTHIINENVKTSDVEQVQADQIDFVRKLAAQSPNPTVVTGDFNCDMDGGLNPWSNAPQKAMQSFLQVGFNEASQGVGSTSGPIHQYDHVFTRGIKGDANAFDARMSDHRGLTMTIKPEDL
jgi:endonuclease/exonuclease/phosphatase family metal-dependent hydrolase